MKAPYQALISSTGTLQRVQAQKESLAHLLVIPSFISLEESIPRQEEGKRGGGLDIRSDSRHCWTVNISMSKKQIWNPSTSQPHFGWRARPPPPPLHFLHYLDPSPSPRSLSLLGVVTSKLLGSLPNIPSSPPTICLCGSPSPSRWKFGVVTSAVGCIKSRSVQFSPPRPPTVDGLLPSPDLEALRSSTSFALSGLSSCRDTRTAEAPTVF